MDVERYEQKIDAADEPAAIWELVIAFVASKGIRKLGYRHVPPLGAPDADVLRISSEGYDEAIVRRYLNDKLYQVDPHYLHGLREAEPFYWDEIPRGGPESDRDRELRALERAAGRDRGVCIPVFGPNARNGLFNFGLPFGPERLPAADVRRIKWACQLAHQRYCAILLENLGPPPDLSRREAEVLAWVARGKSNSIIGEILGISSHTVDAHLRRVYLKLGVFDRITATVRGLGVGLIHADA